jgi:flagella basal body P-ring formation protein FlgA
VQDGKAAVSVPVRFQPAPAAATPIVHAVKVGDQVTVRCESGALVLDTIGIVRQAGAVGEQVNVTIVSTKKLIRAEVIDATTVRVIP